MRPIEIETWALRILEGVAENAFVEDSTVELKAKWIDPTKAARRLAGHANAARGASILWLVGVDEKQGIVGADYQELSSWFQSVQSAFDGVAPSLLDVNVHFDGKTVAALCFETSRAPYLVRNSAFGKTPGDTVAWEIPWREGAKTRTANRNDLILLLNPLRRMPKIELLSGDVRLGKRQKTTDAAVSLSFSLEIYVTPLSEAQVVFPFHKCSARIVGDRSGLVINVEDIRLEPASGRQITHGYYRTLTSLRQGSPQVSVNAKEESIEATGAEMLIRGPGKIKFNGWCNTAPEPVQDLPKLEVQITLVEAISDSEITRVWIASGRQTEQGETIWLFGKENNP